MTAVRCRRTGEIPEGKAVIVGVNIRTLRQRNGWTQTELGELMGWPNASTVCAAEGRRTDGSAVSPPGKSGSWPPSSAYPSGSSRHGA